MTRSSVFLLLLLSLLTGACTVENAKTPEEKNLVIASDYLQEADTLLFADFCRIHKVKLQIVNQNAVQIRKRLKQYGENSGIDVILLESVYNVFDLHKQKLLQGIDFSDEFDIDQCKYTSWKYDFVSFGIDPFIIAYSTDTPNSLLTYNDLTRFDYLCDLSFADKVTLLAPVVDKMKKVNANDWINKFTKHGISVKNLPDSVSALLPVLTTLSVFNNQSDSNLIYQRKRIHYPNISASGVFYNVRTICLADQPENYTVAKEFITFCLQVSNNKRLNKKMGTLSIYATKSEFRPYSKTTEKLLPNYVIVERTLKKIDSHH